MRGHRWFFASWVLLGACSVAIAPEREPEPSATKPPPGPAAPADSRALERVVLTGASVTDGFGVGVDLASVLDLALARAHEPPQGFADALFFSSPLSFGPDLLQEALDEEPTLLVAIDWLFWFGYGHLAADGAPIDAEEDRLALLEKGLGLLEPVACPLVVGDFPDMSPAVGRMLMPAQVPRPETLAALNSRLRAWASDRPQVVVLPLSEFVVQARAGRPPPWLGEPWPAEASELIQADQLHPTSAGTVALVGRVASALVERRLAAEGDFVRDPLLVLERVRELESLSSGPRLRLEAAPAAGQR